MNKSDQKLVEEVKKDYISRREARRSLEAQWQLNINFMIGNQYSYIASNNSIREDEKEYFWQEKEVFNHIAPIVETRISKISSNTPSVTVPPASAVIFSSVVGAMMTGGCLSGSGSTGAA